MGIHFFMFAYYKMLIFVTKCIQTKLITKYVLFTVVFALHFLVNFVHKCTLTFFRSSKKIESRKIFPV